MFPIMETMSKYGPSRYNGNATPDLDSVADSLEYIYADDPKDGNDSSADDDNTKQNLNTAVERNSDYTTKSIADLDSNNETKRRAQSAKSFNSVLENIKEENDKSSDESEYYTLPWRFLPSNFLEDLEFYKHAGKDTVHILFIPPAFMPTWYIVFVFQFVRTYVR